MCAYPSVRACRLCVCLRGSSGDAAKARAERMKNAPWTCTKALQSKPRMARQQRHSQVSLLEPFHACLASARHRLYLEWKFNDIFRRAAKEKPANLLLFSVSIFIIITDVVVVAAARTARTQASACADCRLQSRACCFNSLRLGRLKRLERLKQERPSSSESQT